MSSERRGWKKEKECILLKVNQSNDSFKTKRQQIGKHIWFPVEAIPGIDKKKVKLKNLIFIVQI
jgi:hypothetical protein